MTMIDIEDRPSSLLRDAWRRLRRNRLAAAQLQCMRVYRRSAAFKMTAYRCHVCAGTGPTRPRLRRDWAQRCQI